MNITEIAYNRGAAEYVRRYNKVSGSVKKFATLLEEKGLTHNILEIGCGSGRDARYLAQRRGRLVIATDIATEMIVNAKRINAHPLVVFRQANMLSLPFSKEQFSGVVAESCLLHIPKKDVPLALKGFYDVLQTGGYLLLGLQEGVTWEGYRPEPHPPYEDVYVNVFDKEESYDLVTAAGFTIDHNYSYCIKYNNEPQQHPFDKRKIYARKNP